jgi:ABC-type lipoprotein export system ATPase subunit
MNKIVNIFGSSGSGKTLFIKKMISSNSVLVWFNENYQPKKEVTSFAVSFMPTPKFRGSIKEYLDMHGLNIKMLKKTYPLSRNIQESIFRGNDFDKYVHTLSAGEFRRFCMLRASLQNRELLIIDEPFANSEPKKAKDILEFLRSNSHAIITSHAPLKIDESNKKNIFNVHIKDIFNKAQFLKVINQN